jgi:hypothetical protein
MRDKADSQHSRSILDAVNMGESSSAKVAFALEKKQNLQIGAQCQVHGTFLFLFL